MKQYQLTCRPRHLRYVFFIDENYPYEKVLKIINSNQRKWGGRYNPIIPVGKNVISEKYISLVKHYDPDVVYYTDGIDPEILKKLRCFNPSGYYNLDERPLRKEFSGVDSFYFISQFDIKTNLLAPVDIWKTESPLLEYYKINFGLEENGIVSDHEIGKRYPQIDIRVENFNKLNEIIHLNKPINQASLSKRNLNTKLLRTQFSNDNFEIVIAKDKNSIDDLLYYWNRALYGGDNVLYITLEQLDLLYTDKYFGGVLYDLSHDNTLHVVSLTLTEIEINEIIINKFRPIAFHRGFQYRKIENFPFDILDSNGLFERNYGEALTTQTLISDKGLFHLPKLSFTDKVGFYSQSWAVDIDSEEVGKHQNSRIVFPYTTDTSSIVKGVNGRINKSRNISIEINNHQNRSDSVDINIPDIKDIIRQILIRPIINGESVQTKYLDIGPHDSSNRLAAFFKLFDYEFYSIDELFTDIFWVGLFEELITSEKAAGDSVSFDIIKKRLISLLEKKEIHLGKKEETYQNEENLELGLKRIVERLCQHKVFLKGFALKCDKCASKFWYHIQDIRDNINCKGCLEDFSFPIEPRFSYKLNDLVKNNIYQTKTNRSGNLAVIRTIVSLQRSSRQSFNFHPQVNLYNSFHSNQPCGEIDIICIADGKLIIGEAKHDSKEFFNDRNKSLLSLVEVAKEIRPDKIVLSCYTDSNGKLKKAGISLNRLLGSWDFKPEIETIHLYEPSDFFVGGNSYW